MGDGAGGTKLNTDLKYRINLTYENAKYLPEDAEQEEDVPANRGDDHVEYIVYNDVITLPEGINWSKNVIESIKNGEVKSSISSYSIYHSGGISITNLSDISDSYLYIDENDKVNIAIVIKNSNVKYEADNGYFDISISPGAFEIDLDKIHNVPDEERIIKNDVTAELDYSYSESVILDAHAETPIPITSGKVTFSKSYNRYSSYYGGNIDYTLKLKNSDIYQFTFTKDDNDPNVGLLKDSLDKWYYITPENMEKMLYDEYGDSLIITIEDATLCTDENDMTKVVSAYGKEAYITGENSDLKYEKHDLTICWKNGNIVVCVDGNREYTVSEDSASLENVLDNLGYMVISEDTVFSTSWDLTSFNNGIIYGGQERNYKIYATIKDTFRHGTGDDPIDYKVDSTRIINTAEAYIESTPKASSSRTSTLYNEVEISKGLSVNGVELDSEDTTSLINGDVIDYTVGLSPSTNISYDNLPIVDYLSGVQDLLVTVTDNPDLEQYDLQRKTVDGIEYFVLSKQGTYKEVYVGTDSAGKKLIANDVIVGNDGTTIKWYYSTISDDISISYKTLVDVSGVAPNTVYSIDNIVYANDRTGNRIYATIPGRTVQVIGADKEIYDKENNVPIGDYCVVEEGDTITYRLTLTSLTTNRYVLNGTDVWDVLPETYDTYDETKVYDIFGWEKGVNVSLRLDEKMTDVTINNFDDWYIEQDPETGLFVIRWPETTEFIFDNAAKAYIYVDLIFPGKEYDGVVYDSDYWVAYTAAAMGRMLNNTLHVYDLEFPVYHALQDIGEVYLQKGVYDVGLLKAPYTGKYDYYSRGNRDNYVNSYGTMVSNNTGKVTYVKYYVSLYNAGNARMYLSSLYDVLPDGFKYRSVSPSTGASYALTDVKHMKANVKCTVLEGNTLKFDITAGSGTNAIKYDNRMGMYYLDKGEAYTFVYTCDVGKRENTTDLATNSVRMAYTDYLGGGVKISETEITHSYNGAAEGANDGDCKLVDGNVLESTVSQTRGEILPGIAKSVISYTRPDSSPVTYHNSAFYDAVVNWQIKLFNNGNAALENYTITDTMQAPYTFVTGDNVYATLYIYAEGLSNYVSSYRINLPDEAREEGGVVVSTSYNHADSTVNVKITKDPVSNAETLELKLGSYLQAIPDNGYAVLSLSTKNDSPEMRNKVYINEATLTPNVQEFSSVSEGIPEIDDSGKYLSVSSSAPINVIFGYATSSLKEIYEISKPTNKTNSQASTRYITLSEKTNQFRYTLNVDVPEEKPVSSLVFIDSLPYEGDHSPYSEEVKRGSEFKVSIATDENDKVNPGFEVYVYERDSEGNILNPDAAPIDPSLYKIEYSTKVEFTEEDRSGEFKDSWYEYNDELPPDVSEIRSFRVLLDAEKVTMPENSRISVSFNGMVDSEYINKVEPGEIAWNNFGYYYTVEINGKDYPMEAMPLEVGVRIPSHPTLQKKLVYQEGVTPYVHSEDLEFTYLIHKGEALSDYTNVSESSFEEGQVTIATLKIPAGTSESVVNKRLLEEVNCYALQDGVWVEQENTPFVWTSGETYTVYELPNNDFKLRRFVGQRKNTYTFAYDPSVDRIFVCENSPKKWEIALKKVDSADNTHVLADAKFALYSKDKAEIINDTDYANLSDAPEKELNVSGETWYLVKTAITGEDGKIKFENLMSEVYYLYEYKAPDGYYSKTPGQNLYYSDTVTGTNTVTVENVAGTSLPLTGGSGTAKLLALGLALMATSSAMLYLKKRKFKMQ